MMIRERKQMTQQKLLLHREQHGRCWYCTVIVPMEAATVDHIRPLSKGGNHNLKNLVMACGPCNVAKASRDPEAFKTKARLRWLLSQPIRHSSP